MKRINLPVIVLLGLSAALLLYFLYFHWQLGLTRYFDVDEYAHLHWTAKLLQGKRPYVDFLTFFPPGYWIFLSLSFIGGWGTTAPFFSARVLQFLVFAGMAASASYLFWQVRRSWTMILVGVFLAFLPLPFDKYLEVRPDSLAALLFILAMVFQVAWMEGKRTPPVGFFMGFLYSASVLVLPKMLPNAAVGFVVLFVSAYISQTVRTGRPGEKIKSLWSGVKYPVAGFALPLGLFGVWALTLGDPGLVIYSLVTLPVEANRISRYFIMMPDLFFYPNGIYYGVNGWNSVVYANHALWLAGAVAAVVRLVTPYLARGKRGVLSELLIAGQFLVQVVFYVEIVPLKHAQYLIPIGVFVAFYCADIVNGIWRYVQGSRLGETAFLTLFLACSVFLYRVFTEGNAVKLTWTNAKGMEELTRLYGTVGTEAAVFDLDGRFLYNPDPYYACCIPFGQFAQFLSRPLPPIQEALDASGTKFINQGELKRVNTLPNEAQAYIGSSYSEFPGYPIILVKK